jgi:hypothetical protein
MQELHGLDEPKQRMTDKESQAAKRARDKAIANGTYEKSALELAKDPVCLAGA